MHKKLRTRALTGLFLSVLLFSIAVTTLMGFIAPPAYAVSYNFIDMTRIQAGSRIYQDTDPFDNNVEYTYSHDGCHDKIQINRDDFEKGSSSGSDLKAKLLYEKSFNSSCNVDDSKTETITLTNRGVRFVLAYVIDDSTIWMPEAANYHFNNTGDPYGAKTFRKNQPGDTEYLIVNDDGTLNDFDNGGARIDQVRGGTARYQMNDCAQLGCSTTTLDAKADKDKDRIVLSSTPPNTSVYTSAPNKGGGGGGGGGSSDDPAAADNSCEAAGDFAWILCPVVFALSGAIEWTTTQVSRLLEVDRSTYTNDSLYKAWANIRNIALSVLIIMMLVMVISTALGTQMFDAYTVKRALPRMVAAILFITLSWYICVLLIDVFNQAGSGIMGLMTDPFKSGGIELTDIFSAGIGTFLTNLVGGVGLVIGVLLVMVFFWSTILLSVGIAFLVLLLRQLFVIVLMLLAPLAILAWIFPGNDKLWKTWWGSFSKLLMMYPLIMALLAAGRIFAYLIQSNNAGSAQGFALEPLMALIAFAIPFAFIPFAFKTAGGMFATISGMANDRSKGLFDRARKSRQDKAHRWAEGNAFKGGGERGFRAGINKGIHATTKIGNAGFRPNRMASNIRTAMQDSEESEVKKVMEDESFGVWSGDDAKVSAARYTSHDEIAQELARFDPGRFRGEANRQDREDAVAQILRSQRGHSAGAFQRARVRAMSKTGTGYQYTDANGQTQIDTSRMVDDINAAYGSDRNGAGKALAEMRNNLAQSGHIAGLAGYGTWAGAMEDRFRGRITAQQAHEAIMDDTIDSVSPGQAIYGKPASAAAVGAAHARRINTIARGIGNGTINPATIQRDDQGNITDPGRAYDMDDLSAALAGAAGIYDAMSQASPQNASAMANELMGVEVELPQGGLPTLAGGTVPLFPQGTVRELIQTQMAGNPEFVNRRRDLTQATLAQAQAFQAGAAGGNAAPPANPIGPPPGISDMRLKRNIQHIHTTIEGLRMYRYQYLWSDITYVGVMAQDLLISRPEAVVTDENGFYRVRYDLLGVKMMRLEEWQKQTHQLKNTRQKELA